MQVLTVLPLTNDVLSRVHDIAKRQKQPTVAGNFNGRQGSVNLIEKNGNVEQIIEISIESKQTSEHFVKKANKS